jgi:hypothetical protein
LRDELGVKRERKEERREEREEEGEEEGGAVEEGGEEYRIPRTRE